MACGRGGAGGRTGPVIDVIDDGVGDGDDIYIMIKFCLSRFC